MTLDSMTIEQLADLRDRVIQTLSDKVAARQKELSSEAERLGALVTSKPSTARPKRAVKYQKGSEGWSGVGSQPKFIREHLAGGGSLDELKVPSL